MLYRVNNTPRILGGGAEYGTESFLFMFVGVYRRSVGLFFVCVCVM